MAINQITDLAYRKLKPTDKEQLIKDGGGLFVRIRSIGEGGAISFRLTVKPEPYAQMMHRLRNSANIVGYFLYPQPYLLFPH